jgi:hypothetical protein
MKPRKHIHVKYCWQAYFNSIGTLSQTFKNHIHNNKEIQGQQYFTCMCFLGFIRYNKTSKACGFRKYENLFTHEYHIPLGRCPQGIWHSIHPWVSYSPWALIWHSWVNTFSYFPHQHAINVY